MHCAITIKLHFFRALYSIVGPAPPYVIITSVTNEGFSPFVTPYILYYTVTPYVASRSCMVLNVFTLRFLGRFRIFENRPLDPVLNLLSKCEKASL